MCAHIIQPVPNITLTVPPELHRKMKAHPEIKWSEVVRRILAQRIRALERMDALMRRSALTVADVEELDRLVKEGLRRRYEAARRARGE
jgi:hypothetical protein